MLFEVERLGLIFISLMNVTELARQVRLSTKELRLVLPEIGFDIGQRAIKVDAKVAQEVIRRLGNKAEREKYLQAIQEEQPDNVVDETDSKADEEESKKSSNEIKIPSQVVVKELAALMNVDVTKLVVELMKQGVMASLNDRIDYETASIVAEDFGFKASLALELNKEEGEVRNLTDVVGDQIETGKSRPPVIVVMGHVDHGKTKLLDAIRETNIVDQESGGITQHIGAYQVEVEPQDKKGKQVLTFIDTPGHEAFSLMRSRGAQIADMAILVVAADDGVQPQTIEAVSHIRKAELPFIVAINKIDKQEANQDNVKSGLAEIGITPEDWGGDIMMVPISAKQRINIQDLLESLLLLYEVEKDKIKANPDGLVAGTIIESHVNKGSGPVATVLVQNGTLKQGYSVLVGDVPGRIRSMTNWQGQVVKTAPPSMPVAILGLKSAPQVGDILEGVAREDIRKTSRQLKRKISAANIKDKVISETEGEKFNLIIKADVLGSLEALQESLFKLNSQGISVNIISQGLGYITETDVLQAQACEAYVLGFNSYATPEAEELARTKGVIVKSFDIIYDYLDFVAKEAAKKLSPEVTKKETGRLKVLKIFRTEKNHVIVGVKVVSGEVFNKTKIEHYKNKQRMGQGTIDELQSGKEQVNQVVEGQEAGLKITGLHDPQPGDELVNFQEETKEKKIKL